MNPPDPQFPTMSLLIFQQSDGRRGILLIIPMASFNHEHFRCNFHNWVTQQQQDLDELTRALSTNSGTTNEDLKALSEKGIKHFEDYCGRRALLAKHDAPCFVSPPWCSSFEKAFMWIGGCRPSLCIRLLYYICGSELDEQLEAFLRGERRGNLAELSAYQMERIDALHCETIKEEDNFATRIATLQEEIADEPLAMIAKSAGRVGEWSEELERAMAAHSRSLADVLADADKLRLKTLKEAIAILTPLQAADLLIATKKLHISMHSWGVTRPCLAGQETSK